MTDLHGISDKLDEHYQAIIDGLQISSELLNTPTAKDYTQEYSVFEAVTWDYLKENNSINELSEVWIEGLYYADDIGWCNVADYVRDYHKAELKALPGKADKVKYLHAILLSATLAATAWDWTYSAIEAQLETADLF